MKTKSKGRTQAEKKKKRRQEKRYWQRMTRDYIAWMDANPKEEYGVASWRQFLGEFIELAYQASSPVSVGSI